MGCPIRVLRRPLTAIISMICKFSVKNDAATHKTNGRRNAITSGAMAQLGLYLYPYP
jgi:hypothetical protein